MKPLIILLLSISSACATEQNRYLEITAPSDHAVIDAGHSFTVQGNGKGLFENNVVLKIEDTHGNRLLEIPTTLSTQGIGGKGSWKKDITLKHYAEKVKLIAFSPSPVDGETAISSRPVSLTVRNSMMPALENITWQLTYLIDQEGMESPVLTDTQINAMFVSQKLNGNAGCNSYFGSYKITQHQDLSLTGPIGTTMKSCSTRIDAQEQNYLSLLAKAVKFRIDKENLILLDRSEKPILKFKAEKSTDSLENTKWQANGINNGRGGVLTDKNTHLTTASFVNNEIQGKAACNQFSAPYKIQGEQITIGQARTTRMFCAEEGVMEQETRFLDALTQVSRYELTADRLNFRDQKGALLVNFVKLLN